MYTPTPTTRGAQRPKPYNAPTDNTPTDDAQPEAKAQGPRNSKIALVGWMGSITLAVVVLTLIYFFGADV